MLHDVKVNGVIMKNCYGVTLSMRYGGTVMAMCQDVTLLLNSFLVIDTTM